MRIGWMKPSASNSVWVNADDARVAVALVQRDDSILGWKTL
jgi:hypothetical protein